MTEKTFYIIDGTAYIYRAYHAIRELRASSGFPTNAIFGFTRTILKLVEDRKPEKAVMLFDTKGPNFRHELYPEYKANRPPAPEELVMQIPKIKEISALLGFPILEMQGFEADDLAGTLAKKAEADGYNVVLVTGDKDFVQLVSEQTIIWDPMKEETIDLASVREKFGVEPDKIIEAMGLAGDTSDNIPGVPGIGMKTALNLIKEFGDLETIYEKIDKVSGKKSKEGLINNKDKAFLSRKLVTIDTEVPVSSDIESFILAEANKSELAEIFKELEFRQLHQTFHSVAESVETEWILINDEKSLTEIVEEIKKAGEFAIDTETTSTNPMIADLVGISLGFSDEKAYYIPCGHDYEDAPKQMSIETIKNIITPILTDPSLRKTGQNIKYDLIILERHGFELAGPIFDTMVASYLISPDSRSHGLDQLSLDYLNHKNITFEEVAGKGKSQILFSKVHLDKAVPYACEDAWATFMLRNKLKPLMEKDDLVPLFENIEMNLLPVLKDMEKKGIRIDTDRLESLGLEMGTELSALEETIYELAGSEFNIKSSQQLGEILFERLKLPVQKKTVKKTGFSTDADVLEILSEYHDLPKQILRHRTLSKLKSTYISALLEIMLPETGRIHTSFNQTAAATGRLSSSEPNLQNIPIRGEDGKKIREAFIPREGWTFISADYSQIELRMLAHLSGDEILIEAFEKEEDIHSRTAAEVFQVFPEMMTPELRQQAKAINFGIIYGMGAFKLSKELGISQKMAATYIEHYFARYKKVREFIDTNTALVRETGKIRTISGRIRKFPDINSSNKNIRAMAERAAINTIIQGSSADLIKIAMINMDRMLKEKGLKTTMLLTVHDELLFESPPEETETALKLIAEIMETVFDLKVPLKVNISTGKSWAEAH
ncbi:DNA polymerase I [Desulforegula conservatrix]|uniref:DNA polymerase I n=1 Tax=Desulforegula conservatrix TaxID=153026 RepID=UPI00042840F9|nr:DNA polymerase I [Desulforegula conservatrix]